MKGEGKLETSHRGQGVPVTKSPLPQSPLLGLWAHSTEHRAEDFPEGHATDSYGLNLQDPQVSFF